MTVGGVPELGRGVVVGVGDEVPPAWAGAPEVEVTEAVLADPAATVATLHDAWAERRPVVVRLAVEAERFRAPLSVTGEPWSLGARFEVWFDRLHFLVWANTYDARGGVEPVWWWGRKAARLGASEGGDADVLLPDGSPAWIDGGPRGPLPLPLPDFARDSGSPGPPSARKTLVVHRETVDLGRLDVEPDGGAAPAADRAPDQLAAVAHGAGPARIVAPAGSGKTRVLTERLRHLIVDRRFDRETVLAVAYNKRAQVELETRTADVRPRVSTLNALGYRLLAEHRGRPPRVLDERQVRTIVERLVPPRPRRANTDPLAPYLEGLTAVRLGLRDPREVEAERDDVPGLAEAYRPFRRALAEAGAVDFDEQIYAAVEALLADGAFRRRVQPSFRHLLVDEFQDLTPAHVLLVRLLASPALDVFGVGDDDQVIYGHAGADPGFLIDFADLFPGAADHPLEVNYRCPVTVVHAARTLLSYNRRRVPKAIRPGPDADPADGALEIRRHRPEAGASELVQLVRGWLDDGVAASDMAVLTRVNSLLLAPHVALTEAGVPVHSALSPDVLNRTGVRAALAYLHLGADPSRLRPDDLQEVLRRPSRGFPQWIGKWMQRTMSLDDLRRLPDRLGDDKVALKIEGLADDLAVVADAIATGTTRSALAAIADGVGLAGAMALLDSSKGGQSGSQLDDLDALAQVADLHPDPRTFEAWLRDVLQRPAATDGISLSTVHRVKGMEWDRVAVFGVSEGVLPHRLALEEDAGEEEERRVLHVAITRGRHQVVVLADASRPSSFLDELTGTARQPEDRPKRTPVAAFALKSAAGSNARGRSAPEDLPPEAVPAEEALRAWRLERARADKVSAFIIASNALLRSIAVRRPTTAKELLAVHGMGPSKLDLYGDEILAVLDALP